MTRADVVATVVLAIFFVLVVEGLVLLTGGFEEPRRWRGGPAVAVAVPGDLAQLERALGTVGGGRRPPCCLSFEVACDRTNQVA
jgi:hypothetical protein